MLFFAGGYEFVQPQAANAPSRKRLEYMAKAFDLLHHDVLFVTPEERALLARAGVQPRPSWKGSDKLEQHILNVKGVKIGLLILPPVAFNAPSVPRNLIHQVENAVHGLRGEVKIIIAMSPWGYMKEQELLRSPGPHPDILMGSGPGIGLVGSLPGDGKTAWIRSFSQGKSILRLDVLSWPEHNPNFKWTEDKNIRMTLYGLTDQYQENPQLLNLMHSMGTD